MGRGEGHSWANARLLDTLVAVAEVILVLAAAGCGSADTSFPRSSVDGGASPSGVCQAGDTRACVGPGQCAGGQICSDQRHWGSCDCGSAPTLEGGVSAGAGGASAASSGGASSLGGAPVVGVGGQKGLAGAPTATLGTPIGRPCKADADCGASKVICLSSASIALGGDGPPNGLCVADCTSDPTTCAKIDPSSLCLASSAMGGRAFCFEKCTVGSAVAGTGSTTKCHGRPDFACDDAGGTGPSDAFCRPMCRNNADCPGRRCNLGSGLCEDAAASGGTLPIGAPCDTSAAVDPCGGVCLPLSATGTSGECSGFCSLGGLGCGAEPNSTAPLQSACLFDATTAGVGDVGDIGLCGGLCDCDSQCTAVGRVCVPLTGAEGAALGRAGYCGGLASASGHIAKCP